MLFFFFFRSLSKFEREGKADLCFLRASFDLLATLATKRTPVLEVKFTNRNLCLAAGGMLAD